MSVRRTSLENEAVVGVLDVTRLEGSKVLVQELVAEFFHLGIDREAAVRVDVAVGRRIRDFEVEVLGHENILPQSLRSCTLSKLSTKGETRQY